MRGVGGPRVRRTFAACTLVAVTLVGGVRPATGADDDAGDRWARSVLVVADWLWQSSEGPVDATGASWESASPVVPQGEWDWPLPGTPAVLRRFDPPAQRWLPGHRGVDLAGWVGAPVLAVEEGVVSYSGTIAGVGIVTVRHTDGLRSTYQPVTKRVATGTSVTTGERIGVLAEKGGHCLVRVCLHLGAVRGPDHYVDPLLLLYGWEISLLRLGD